MTKTEKKVEAFRKDLGLMEGKELVVASLVQEKYTSYVRLCFKTGEVFLVGSISGGIHNLFIEKV